MNVKCSVQVQIPDFKFLQVGGGVVGCKHLKRARGRGAQRSSPTGGGFL